MNNVADLALLNIGTKFGGILAEFSMEQSSKMSQIWLCEILMLSFGESWRSLAWSRVENCRRFDSVEYWHQVLGNLGGV